MPINSFDTYPMSWKPVLDRQKRPLYQSLAKQLEEDIREGRLSPGTRLPPQRELADFLDINLSTVTKALRLCRLKGLLSSATGSGTFVSYDARTNWRLTMKTAPSAIDMGPTVPDDSADPILTALLQDMLKENGKSYFSYQLEEDAPWQKDIAAGALLRCGYQASASEILLANGGQTGLFAILSTLFRQGDRIAANDHTYPGLKEAAALLGLVLVPVPEDDEGLSSEALDFLCRTEDIKGVYLIPTCHNPTTLTMSESRRREIAHLSQKHDFLIIEDGTYQLMRPGMTAVSQYAPDRGLYLASLSKAIAPGLRMAYLSVPPAYYPRVSESLYSLSISVSPLLAELSARVLAGDQLKPILARRSQILRRRDKILASYVPSAQLRGRHDDLFRWLLLPRPWTGASFVAAASKRGLILYGAEKFAIGKTRPAPAVRLSLSRPKRDQDVEIAAKIIGNLLKERY